MQMHCSFSLRTFLLATLGCSILLGAVIDRRRDHQRAEALLQILPHYGFTSESTVACYPVGYAEFQPTGLFVRIRPRTAGTLWITYYRHATDEATVREIAVTAKPKFELTLTIIQRTGALTSPSGWIASAAWLEGINDQSISNEILFVGDETRWAICSTPERNRHKGDRLAGVIYLIPVEHASGVPMGTNSASEATEFCKKMLIDAIFIEYVLNE
jgi:hypothetical protein